MTPDHCFKKKEKKDYVVNLSYLCVTRMTKKGVEVALVMADATRVVRYAVRPQVTYVAKVKANRS